MLWLTLVSFLWAGDDGAVIIELGGKIKTATKHFQPQKKRKKEPKISVDLHKADIHSVIRLFAAVSGKSFVVSDGVQGKVTMRLENVYWSDALQAVLWSQGLAAQDMGSVVVLRSYK